MKKWIIIILLVEIGIVSIGYSKDAGETKTATVSYKVNSNDEIDIRAKYTDLKVEAWNKDEVLIEATIRFDGKMTDKMQSFLDNFEEEVTSNIDEQAGKLLIKTNLDEPNKFQIGSKTVGIIIGFSEDELRLEYSIKVPSRNRLSIENSYRNVQLTGDFREVKIDQYSGELTTGNLEKAELRLKYGKATLGSLGEAEMELYEQEISAKEMASGLINCKYSDLEIQVLGVVEINGYETEYELETISSLTGNMKYGNLEIAEKADELKLTAYEIDVDANRLTNTSLVEMKYGKFEANSVGKLDIEKVYEVDFEIEQLTTATVEEAKYGDFNVDQLNGDLLLKQTYEIDTDIESISSNTSLIRIEGKYGNISLGLKNQNYTCSIDGKYGSINLDRDDDRIKKYIKDGDQIEVEVTNGSGSGLRVEVKGYELDVKVE